ncbi:MAG: gamma-glutamylcyclotransferase, partial [bacterium]|nr:gamma-glutamylcyclotransferase [bacterium]
AYVVQTEFIDVRLKPFDWYKTLVLEGAKLHGLPGDYIAEIETVETIPDPDPEREAENLSVLLG